ncbi:hypothetical protein BKA93DRAFT_784009 [Sparassis latifolia]|uniref:Uncharacterized protein n=1 Tax=Sparassis crispa TaxID=139825 RepID=A0A401GS84_9APHY|nr:hypothetical protein SCP_0702880 [Sparassis crispa]GBE85102.1 hypothetical protein SCP_0702880 [Sparassis crispa]
MPGRILIADLLLTEDFRGKFEESMTPQQQETTVRALKNMIERVRHGTDGDLLMMGVMKPGDLQAQKGRRVADCLNMSYWQMALFLRFSVPTRIAEAEPYLRIVVRDFNDIHHGEIKDALPMLYLASSIQKVLGNEQEALEIFREAFDYYEGPKGNPMGYKSELWARANFARLLRKMRKVADAEEQEKKIRTYMVNHPFGVPPSEYRKVLVDDTEENSLKYTWDHPLVRRSLRHIGEMPSHISPNVPLHEQMQAVGGTGEVPKVHEMSHAAPKKPKRRRGGRRS